MESSHCDRERRTEPAFSVTRLGATPRPTARLVFSSDGTCRAQYHRVDCRARLASHRRRSTCPRALFRLRAPKYQRQTTCNDTKKAFIPDILSPSLPFAPIFSLSHPLFNRTSLFLPSTIRGMDSGRVCPTRASSVHPLPVFIAHGN